jgi:hypothetical protein
MRTLDAECAMAVFDSTGWPAKPANGRMEVTA